MIARIIGRYIEFCKLWIKNLNTILRFHSGSSIYDVQGVTLHAIFRPTSKASALTNKKGEIYYELNKNMERRFGSNRERRQALADAESFANAAEKELRVGNREKAAWYAQLGEALLNLIPFRGSVQAQPRDGDDFRDLVQKAAGPVGSEQKSQGESMSFLDQSKYL